MVINSVGKVRWALESIGESRQKLNPMLPPEYFFDWFPPPKRECVTARLNLNTLPGKILSAYDWSFVWKDHGRTNVLGVGDNALTCTGAEVMGIPIGATRSTAALTSNRVEILPDAVTADENASGSEDEAEPVDAAAVADVEFLRPKENSEIPQEWAECDGWKCSAVTSDEPR